MQVAFDKDHIQIAKSYGGVPILEKRKGRLALAIRLPNGKILHDFQKEIRELTLKLTKTQCKPSCLLDNPRR